MQARTTSARTKRRRSALAVASAVGLASALVAGPASTAGADEPYLPQDVGLDYELAACDLHLSALAEIEYGAEVHVTISGNAPVVYEETFVIADGGTGMFAETLHGGDDFMLGADGGAHIAMELTYQGAVIDTYEAPLLASISCPDVVPLEVTVDAVGDVPADAQPQVAVRTGECGNTQTPAAVITSDAAGGTYTVLALPGATCPSPVDSLGAAVSYVPDQQTQVEDLVGAEVTVVFDFPSAPVVPVDPPDHTTSTTAGPTTTTTVPVAVRPATVARAAAASPVSVSPSFTG